MYFTLGVLSMVLIVLCLGLLALVVGQLPNNVRGMQFMVQFGIILLGTTLSVLVPMFGVSNIRTAWLRGKIQKHLSAMDLRQECEYSLIGLTIVDGGIFCPECGQRFDLARGLTAAGQSSPRLPHPRNDPSVPLLKAYREFPELDRFSDAECEGFVRLAKSQNRPATYLWTLVGVLVAGFSIPVGFALTMFIANVVAKRGGPSAGSNATLIAFAGILLSLIGGAMLGVITYERWLKRPRSSVACVHTTVRPARTRSSASPSSTAASSAQSAGNASTSRHAGCRRRMCWHVRTSLTLVEPAASHLVARTPV